MKQNFNRKDLVYILKQFSLENDRLYSGDKGRELCSEHTQIPLKISKALRHSSSWCKTFRMSTISVTLMAITAKQLAVLAKALGRFLPWRYFLKILLN